MLGLESKLKSCLHSGTTGSFPVDRESAIFKHIMLWPLDSIRQGHDTDTGGARNLERHLWRHALPRSPLLASLPCGHQCQRARGHSISPCLPSTNLSLSCSARGWHVAISNYVLSPKCKLQQHLNDFAVFVLRFTIVARSWSTHE
jgi:hypothetical protein